MTSTTLTTIALSAAFFAASPLPALAAAHSNAPVSNAATGHKVTGEVRKIDESAKKITLRHDELKHLDMPAMTMVFQVKDAAMLDKVKKGDKVKFIAEKVEGQFTVTDIEAME